MPVLSSIGSYKIYVFDLDLYENRKHVHILDKQDRRLAKIWLETNNVKDVQIEYSKLSGKAEKIIIRALKKNWKLRTYGQFHDCKSTTFIWSLQISGVLLLL